MAEGSRSGSKLSRFEGTGNKKKFLAGSRNIAHSKENLISLLKLYGHIGLNCHQNLQIPIAFFAKLQR